ncbi:unnamed protein product [Allacma fusca]|uniref:CRAL-TRIO domain-containing protein n=1 Tax=Allacma fusca TaxID=39272 RepID=A0A8J2JT84_9HEXA|nr:unnamed protein product [Allacma fusca]
MRTKRTRCNLTDSAILAFNAPAEIKNKLPYYLSGYDEDGAPIWIIEAGKWDMRKYVEKVKHLKTVQFMISKFGRFEQITRNGSLKQGWVLNANHQELLEFEASKKISDHNLTDSEIYAFDVPAEIQDEFSYYLSGYDEDGAPIFIIDGGKWDMRKYVEKGGKLYDAMDVFIERMYLTFRDSGLNSTGKQFVALTDMEGFDIRQAGDVKTVQFILSQYVRFEQIARAGSMKRVWVVNANALFEGIWRIGSRTLGTLAESMEVFGTNKDLWKPKLLKDLPRDQIPEIYGGLPNHKPLKVFG